MVQVNKVLKDKNIKKNQLALYLSITLRDHNNKNNILKKNTITAIRATLYSPF